MKLSILCFLLLAFDKFCYSHQVSHVSALRNAILEGYERDAKPDGKVEVKTGMKVTKISLCPYKQV